MEMGSRVTKAEGRVRKRWFQKLGFLKGCVSIKDNDDTTRGETLASPSNVAPPTPIINFHMSLCPKRSLLQFSYEELSMATKNFSSHNYVGHGSFGIVFKGGLIENATGERVTVAVKTLNPDGLQGHREWLAEVYFLGDLHHPNVVKLIGYCIEADQRMLVYEYMPRGSLKNHLFREPLSWPFRVKVALDAAKGLEYLHEEAEKQVIYRDFKTSNILLDTDFTAKLSDFGLARDGPAVGKTHVSTRVMGTCGYAAPEYLSSGHLTIKSDVYSFGVVLLELLSGRKAVSQRRGNTEQYIVDWARPYLGDRRRFCSLIDPHLQGHFSLKAAHTTVRLVAFCISPDPKDRPMMSEVVKVLEPLLDCDDMVVSSPTFGPAFAQSSRVNQISSPKQHVPRLSSRPTAQ